MNAAVPATRMSESHPCPADRAVTAPAEQSACDQQPADEVGRADADPPARQRAVRGDLLVAAAVDDVVEAHPEAVQPGRDHHDRDRPLPRDLREHLLAAQPWRRSAVQISSVHKELEMAVKTSAIRVS